MNFTSQIEQTILTWEGTTTIPHRYGGREFQLAGKEFGHIHFNGMLDILFTKKIREILVEEHLTNLHHLLPETGWTSLYTNNLIEQLEPALKLLRLNYLLQYSKLNKSVPDSSEIYLYPKRIQEIIHV